MSRIWPSLDDLTYAELVDGARSRLPLLDPAWTDHNPADPGITLLELFAWLSEMLVYRTDQIPEERYRAFLALLRGPDATTPTVAVDTAIAETLRELRTPWRAASASDIEYLITTRWPADPAAAGFPAVRRVHCVPRRDLTADPDQDRPGTLSVVIVPQRDPAATAPPVPSQELRDAVHAWLEPRRLLGVRHRVVGPTYVPVTITARLVLRPGYATAAVARSGVLTDAAIVADVARNAAAALTAAIDPVIGGAEAQGWPFGRDVFLSDLYRLLDGLPGVDYVDGLRLVGVPPDRVLDDAGEVVGMRLGAAELPDPVAVDDAGTPGLLTVVAGGSR